MTIAVALRGDFKASQLRGLARKTKDGPQARRLLAVAAIYDGAPRTEAAGLPIASYRPDLRRPDAAGSRAVKKVLRFDRRAPILI
jgi:hypothetical protein